MKMSVLSNLKVLVAAAGVLGMSVQAQAGTITIDPATAVSCAAEPEPEPVCLALTGPETSQAAINLVIYPFMGAGVIEGYKQNAGEAGDSGPGGNYYTTTFSNGNSNALITWDGSLYFTADPLYLLVKDGNHSPAWYLFALTDWDGKDTLSVENFWVPDGVPDVKAKGKGKGESDGGGAISHVTIYGKPSGPDLFCTNCVSVPDGGSATILLGMGLLGLVALRRRMGRI